MADAIREVLIRGRMEIIKADLAVPDITAFTKQLEAQNKLAQDQAAFLGQLIDQQQKREQQAKADDEANKQRAAEDARIRAEQRKAAEQARKEREEAKRLAAEVAAAEKAAAEAAKAAEEQRRKEIEETNRAREEAIRKQREISDALLKGGDALKTAGDGAFAFARGLTLIGLEGDANLEKVARSIASVQAKFDLFRGSVDIIKGGVESFRAFSLAITASGGAVTLLTSRLAPLIAFLGPTGLIIAGLTAVAVAVKATFDAFADDVDSAASRSEKRLSDFLREAERVANQARNAFEKQDAIRETLSAEDKIASIRQEQESLAGGISAQNFVTQQGRFFRGGKGGPAEIERLRSALGEDEFAERIKKEQEAAAARFAEQIAVAERKQGLGRELLSATGQRDDAANRERELAIREAEQKENDLRKERERKQEELKRAEEQRAEQARRQAAERAGFSASDRAFVDRASQNIQGLSAKELERLKNTAGENFGQDVTDELVRRGGGTVAERTDTVAELKAAIADLSKAIESQSSATGGLRSADATADAEAKANKETVATYLRDLAEEINRLRDGQAAIDSRFREVLP